MIETADSRRRATPAALAATVLLLIAGLASAAATPGEGEAQPQPSAQTSDAEPADDTARASDTGSPDRSAPEVFVPSEEISEDFAVSFPVDI